MHQNNSFYAKINKATFIYNYLILCVIILQYYYDITINYSYNYIII